MKVIPFDTERYFARYEFKAPYLLSVSDCETTTIGELLALAGIDQEAFANLKLGYTESLGHPHLREEIARRYAQATADNVLVLSSPVEGIFLAMQALLEPGDEAIVLTPAYDALINMPRQIARMVYQWQLQPTATGWELDLDRLQQLVSARTRLIVVNFPHNPTGFLPALAQLEEIIQIARQHGIWLFCDEMYRGLEIEPAQTLPSAVDLYERSLVLSGLSKTHGLPGLRAGWLIVRDPELFQSLVDWKYYTSICPAAPTEFLALAALQFGEGLIQRGRMLIDQNLDLAEAFFGRWRDLFHWRLPQAGSVALIGVNVPSASEFCQDLVRESGVLLLPGVFMGAEDRYVRFGFGRQSFPTSLNQLEKYLNQGGY